MKTVKDNYLYLLIYIRIIFIIYIYIIKYLFINIRIICIYKNICKIYIKVIINYSV